MKKSWLDELVFAFAGIVFVGLIGLILIHEYQEMKAQEKINITYNLLEAKGGVAVFEGLALVDLESFGGKYSYQDLIGLRGAKKYLLKDPVTEDLYIGLRVAVGGIGIFRVDKEGKILQQLTPEEFYESGVVDRLVK